MRYSDGSARLKIAHLAREILHEFDPTGEQCEPTCCRCLCNYYNQSIHDKLDRNLALPILAQVESAGLRPMSSTNNKAHYDELMKLCESEFERNVLREIRTQGAPLPDGAQKSIYSDGVPFAQADFFYAFSIVTVFVDGADLDLEHVKKADEMKRQRLELLGYRLFVIRYNQDIAKRIADLAKWVTERNKGI
jgi:hypothetical protein